MLVARNNWQNGHSKLSSSDEVAGDEGADSGLMLTQSLKVLSEKGSVVGLGRGEGEPNNRPVARGNEANSVRRGVVFCSGGARGGRGIGVGVGG